MLNLVYLNGNIVEEADAKVSVFDHGFLYGDGVFETMRAYNGRVFKLEEHLSRLEKSAGAIELEVPLSKEELSQGIYATLKANNLLQSDAYIRLSLSRGEGPIGIDPRTCPNPTLVIMAKGLPPYDEEVYGKGTKIIVVETKRNLIEALDPSIKSFNFLNNIMAKIELNRVGVKEGLMLNYEGYITEGTISNVFMVKGGALITPPPQVGILEGITRNTVIQLAHEANIEVLQKEFKKEDLYLADEVFLTNSSGELMPVIDIDGNIIGKGNPGPINLKLLQRYRELTKEA